MARLYMELTIYETNAGGVWMHCVAGASGIEGFFNTEVMQYFTGDPDSATLISGMMALAIAAIFAETGVTLSASTAIVSGGPVDL